MSDGGTGPAPVDSNDRKLLNLIAEQARKDESPLAAARRIIAEREALLAVVQGTFSASREILTQCGFPVDAMEPNAGQDEVL